LGREKTNDRESSSEEYDDTLKSLRSLFDEGRSVDVSVSPVNVLPSGVSHEKSSGSDSSGSQIVNVGLSCSNEQEEWPHVIGCGSLNFNCDACQECKCIVCDKCQHSEDGHCVHCDLCSSYAYDFDVDKDDGNDDEDVEILSPTEARNQAIKNDFKDIALAHLVPHNVVDDLLAFYRKYEFGDFPKTSSTLFATPSVTPTRCVPPGEYWHRGITADLVKYVEKTRSSKIEISFSVDGVPISSSSNSSFWPILCSLNGSDEVILAGAYHGFSKPEDSNVFLEDFLDELKPLCESGLLVKGRSIPVCLSKLHADAPAIALVLKMKNFNGYCSCRKCLQEGEMAERRMSFPEIGAPPRTDESFRSQQQKEHHVGVPAIQDFPGFGPVSSVPYDYLHLVLLGAMRKKLYMWIQGPLNVRMKARSVSLMSDCLASMSQWKPREFNRRPRSLQYIKRFKGTEFRQILFYLGPTVFMGALRKDLYEHFLVFHVAMYILAHPQFSEILIDYAEGLLNFYVRSFKQLYGSAYVSHNIHGLTHLADDVRRFGHLDKFSTFKYENYMQFLIKLVRKGEKPLQQLSRRYSELTDVAREKKPLRNEFSGRHLDGPLPADCSNPQFCRFQMAENILMETSEPNNCCQMQDGSIVIVRNFSYSRTGKQMVVVGQKFLSVKDLYKYPLPSSKLGIHFVTTLSSLQTWPVKWVRKKMYRVPLQEGFSVVPLLHSHSEK